MITSSPQIPENLALDLTGKVVVITGGEGGVAMGFAEVVHRLGGTALLPRRAELDVSLNMSSWVERQMNQFGVIDVWVNAAGVIYPDDLVDSKFDDWKLTYDINVLAVVRSVKALWPYWKTRGGMMLNISSTSGLRGRKHWGSYSASKAAVNSVTESLAAEGEEFGIFTYALCIGRTKSKMRNRLFPDEDQELLMNPGDLAELSLGLIVNTHSIPSGTKILIKQE